MRRYLRLLACALTILTASTTTASSATYAYDATPLASVDANACARSEDGQSALDESPDRSAFPSVAARGASTSAAAQQVATEAAGSEMGMLTEAESSGLQASLDPNKLNHLFEKAQHGFDPLVEQFGSREAVVEEMYRGLQGLVPETGRFTVTRIIGGQSVLIDGAVVNGVPRIGTAYVP